MSDEQFKILRKGLGANYSYKYVLLVDIGIATGLRISDITNIKVGDIKKDGFKVTERKTKKSRSIKFSTPLYKAIEQYIKQNHLKPGDYLIFSTANKKHVPLSRIQSYRIINAVAKRNGLEGIGTHSLRKTFASMHYRQHKDIDALQKILNHKYKSTTLLYLFGTTALAKLNL